MASTACFMIVNKNDIPIYEAEKEDAAHLHQFILHAALDIVQDVAWTTSAMFLKAMDRFDDLVVLTCNCRTKTFGVIWKVYMED
ncbi:uncharacterized protein [Primulina eburnea]|uniref:uncharacterized protein n=1 Tax=Primulina eburnea TaxID=1245227 RepID=UPI003C6BE329